MTDPFATPNLSIIVAIAQNNAIGKDNNLLWHISDDLKRFKAITSGHTVVMGRNTWNSLPRRPLPKRRNIVLTHDLSFSEPGAEVAHSIAAVLDMVRGEEEAFIIGGAEIYRQFLPFARRLYVTWVWKDFLADAFSPVIDGSVFVKTDETERFVDPETNLPYSFAVYDRKP
ncbi:MAG: dihydrofolate reductase [Bacteroidales bacterium]|nr:dihydrofolate reductase [Bacteroidales bacterium]